MVKVVVEVEVGAVLVVAVKVVVVAVVVNSTDTAGLARRTCLDSRFITSSDLGQPFTLPSDSDKKIHQGWGGDDGGAELKAEEAGTTDAQAEGATAATDDWGASAPADDPWGAPPPAAADDWGAPPAEGDNAPAVEGEKGDDGRKPRERELEEEDNTISLDQYLAQLKDNTTASVPKLDGVREANEGADNVWGDVTEHKRNEDEEAYYVGKVR